MYQRKISESRQQMMLLPHRSRMVMLSDALAGLFTSLQVRPSPACSSLKTTRKYVNMIPMFGTVAINILMPLLKRK